MTRLWSFLDALPRSSWPFLLRGDVGYGNDGIMSEAETRGLRYLFKIKRTGLAKELFAFLADDNEWKDCGCGWEAHREPVTSRPAFLNIVGRIVRNGGRRVIHLTSTHADASGIRDSLNLIGQFLGWVDSIAEQLEPDARWTLVLTVAFRKLLRFEPHRGPIPTLLPA